MKIAYIAGPYRAGHGRTVEQNIAAARKVAEKYWKMGYAVLCPHLNSALMDGLVDDKQFLAAGIEFVRMSHVVIAMHNWPESEGAKAEIDFADYNEIPVVYEDVVP